MKIHPRQAIASIKCHVSRVTAAFPVHRPLRHYARLSWNDTDGESGGAAQGVAAGMKSRSVAEAARLGPRQWRSISPGDGDAIGNCR